MEDYLKEVCPYDIGQLLVARGVLQWAIKECPQIPNNVCMNNVFNLIDDAILKEVIRQIPSSQITKQKFINKAISYLSTHTGLYSDDIERFKQAMEE